MKCRSFATALLIGLLTALCTFADSSRTSERTVHKLAEGVYTIRHKDAPDTFPQGNTTVIIGDREGLVVDSCYLPSSAREDIAEIRKWTDKPVSPAMLMAVYDLFRMAPTAANTSSTSASCPTRGSWPTARR